MKKMKKRYKKSLAVILIVYMIGMTFSGCQLAGNGVNESKEKPRLIGIFATKAENYITEKIYAQFDEIEKRYVFNDIKGLNLYTPTVNDDEDDASFIYHDSYGMSDIKFAYIDESVSTEANVYVNDEWNDSVVFFYGIYQEKNSVYIMPDDVFQGEYINASIGVSLTKTFNEKIKVNDDDGTLREENREIKLNFVYKVADEKIIIREMNKENNTIKEKIYDVDNMPESITPQKDTQYIIVDKIKDSDKKVTGRDIYNRVKADEENSILVYKSIEDGISVEEYINIEWQ